MKIYGRQNTKSDDNGIEILANSAKCPNFFFCHSPSSLKGTVMLANPQRIIDNILKDAVEPNYFWIYQNHQTVTNILEELTLEVRQNSLIFQRVSEVHQFLSQNSVSYTKIIIICSPQSKNENQNLLLLRKQGDLGILLFNLGPENQVESQGNQSSSQEFFNLKDSYHLPIEMCESKVQLKKFLQCNKWNLAKQKIFPNFLFLKKEIEKATIQSRLIVSMIEEVLTPDVRSQIIIKLSQLISLLGKFHPKLYLGFEWLQEALMDFKNGSWASTKIIRLYSSEKHLLYVLLNSFLKGLSCPTEAYYIQPIVKEMFWAVKKLYLRTEEFTCFRGGFINNEEFYQMSSAVGEIVQNLGFLSTSKSKNVADRFKKNTTANSQLCGFAEISKFSEFFFEEEILFNPLNYFKFLETTEINFTKSPSKQSHTSFCISLAYISFLENKQQDQNVQVTNMMFQLHKQNSRKFKSQSRTLLRMINNKNFPKAEIYFQFFKNTPPYKRISDLITSSLGIQNFMNKRTLIEMEEYFEISLLMGSNLIEKHRFDEGLKLVNVCKKLIQSISGIKKFQEFYFEAQLSIAISLFNQERYQQGVNILFHIEDKNKNIQGDISQTYLQILNTLGAILISLQRTEALPILKKCYNMYCSTLGKLHPSSLMVLCNVGNAYQLSGMFQKSYEAIMESEHFQRQICGENDLLYLNTLHNLAQVLELLNKKLTTQGMPI